MDKPPVGTGSELRNTEMYFGDSYINILKGYYTLKDISWYVVYIGKNAKNAAKSV